MVDEVDERGVNVFFCEYEYLRCGNRVKPSLDPTPNGREKRGCADNLLPV